MVDDGSKIFQTKRIVHTKAHKHRRPQSICEVEKNLVSWRPRTMGWKQWDKKLRSSGDTALKRSVAWTIVGISGSWGLGWRTIWSGVFFLL